MDIKALTQAMHLFVSTKGWYDSDSQRPQTPKNLAVSLSIETAELLELFQWVETTPDRDRLAGELADVMLYLLQLASISGIDLEEAVMSKLQINYDRHWGQPEPSKKDARDDEN